MQTCTRCEQEKPFWDFYRKDNERGRCAECIACILRRKRSQTKQRQARRDTAAADAG